MLLKVPTNHLRTFWSFPDNGCDHEYEEDNILIENDWSCTYECVHCKGLVGFSVEDIGD